MAVILWLLSFLLAPPAYVSRPARSPSVSAPEPTAESGAGISFEEAFPPEIIALSDGYSLVELTVVAADRRGVACTNGAPPRLTVDVARVIAGAHALGEVAAEWAPPPSGIDWSGPGVRALWAAWGRKRLPSPVAGARLIVVGRAHDGVYRISAALREPYSEALERDLRARIDAARAAAVAERAAAETRARAASEDERRRLAEVDPIAMLGRARIAVVATMHVISHDADGIRVALSVDEVLAPRGDSAAKWSGLQLVLVGAEQERVVDGAKVIVFAAWRRWPAALGGETDGYRIVDPRFGVLPAVPAFLEKLRR